MTQAAQILTCPWSPPGAESGWAQSCLIDSSDECLRQRQPPRPRRPASPCSAPWRRKTRFQDEYAVISGGQVCWPRGGESLFAGFTHAAELAIGYGFREVKIDQVPEAHGLPHSRAVPRWQRALLGSLPAEAHSGTRSGPFSPSVCSRRGLALHRTLDRWSAPERTRPSWW
jgi:hypothetical protein